MFKYAGSSLGNMPDFLARPATRRNPPSSFHVFSALFAQCFFFVFSAHLRSFFHILFMCSLHYFLDVSSSHSLLSQGASYVILHLNISLHSLLSAQFTL